MDFFSRIKNNVSLVNRKAGLLSSFSTLFIRLILAYGFYMPAKEKWSDIKAVGDWFAELGIPFAHAQAYLAAGTESLGIVLLSLGLFTRWISIPLMVTMFVAIATVHGANGFAASDNGFEIPLYYLIFLFTLMANGPGKFSVDYVLGLEKENSNRLR